MSGIDSYQHSDLYVRDLIADRPCRCGLIATMLRPHRRSGSRRLYCAPRTGEKIRLGELGVRIATLSLETQRRSPAPSFGVSALATRTQEWSVEDQAQPNREAWRKLREELEQRRIERRRFRHDPKGFLKDLENKVIQSRLQA